MKRHLGEWADPPLGRGTEERGEPQFPSSSCPSSSSLWESGPNDKSRKVEEEGRRHSINVLNDTSCGSESHAGNLEVFTSVGTLRTLLLVSCPGTPGDEW